ncbi:hypothetical protein [Luteimicrobium subarcticum]|uniref:Uncharacterized protein n=1 Tax=Luteimicrobium subarcticum TaxID=620910 RepID=A0A2M8WRU7_9MICO|nr:hypothetical protein [Luteimicrobium subarcticum]PJI93661.1 hypothetical protein CLV34_1135 [Luteimicrobium subarcticum]
MTLWLRVRHGRSLLLVLLGAAVCAATLRDAVVHVPPVLGGGSSPVSVSLLLPLVFAVWLAAALGAAGRVQERAAVRRLPAYDVALWCGATLAVALVLVTLGLCLGGDVGSTARVTRDVVLLGALVAALVPWTGPAGASAVTVAVVLLASSYGVGADGARYVRAFEQPASSVPAGGATAVVVLMALVGVGVRAVPFRA